MTCVTALKLLERLKYLTLQSTVIVSEDAASVGGTTANLFEGDYLSI